MRRVAKTKAVMGAALLAGAFIICGDALADATVKPGDRVQIDFTCRLQNGEVAATTDKAVDQDPTARKAFIYQPRRGDESLKITAGGDEKTYGKPGQRGFEGEIVAEAAHAALGMKPGESKNVEIKRDARKPDPRENMILDMARVRVRPKSVKMTPDEYKTRTGKGPEVGQNYTIDPSFPGKVISVSENAVAIRFEAELGKVVKTPLGDGVIRETEHNYEIVIDAKRGSLVRAGNLVGRIVNVDERMVTIDYSHPFGYEELNCEVKVEDVSRP